jgi:outer membrane protein OmpA-like peptidoglycan-associated protein
VKQEELLEATSGSSTYDHRISLGVDAFSGYAVLRSPEMQQQLRGARIRLDIVDDSADYESRLAKLASGELQMAAFPIDALLKACERLGSLPATIVTLIDETRGADALVAYKSKYPNIDSLNSPETKFVLVGGSPSDTLVRVLMHDFQLQNITGASFVPVASEKEIVARYKRATPQSPEVFVTWEPVVSELLENDQLHVLIDSSRQTGYIVDALVVSRDYLVKNEAVVRAVVEGYFRTLYSFNDREKLVALVMRDAANAGTRLSDAQASKLVEGILWKNTQENLAHFGLRSAAVPHVEDLIDRIKRVLLQTEGLRSDPTAGDSRKLFYEQVLQVMQASGFHPGIVPEAVREDQELPALTTEQWSQLVPVGTAQVPPLVYARGTATLIPSSQVKLDDLVEKLKSWPSYYVMVRGNAGSQGDLEANRKLAKQRADAAVQYLRSKGVSESRVQATEGGISGQMSVTFVLGQPPF